MKNMLLFGLTVLCCLFPDHTFCTNLQAQEVALTVHNGVLKGTLLTPVRTAEIPPLILFISGSGPTDRDGNQPQMKNNSIRLLAEALQKAGIASFRYDKRGSGHSISSLSERELSLDIYIGDAKEWISYLSGQKNFRKIIVAGHSEGALVGLIASIKNPDVAAYISIAGSGAPIDQLLEQQLSSQSPAMAEEAHRILESLKKGVPVENISPALQILFRPSVQPYLISCMKYDPAGQIRKLNIPVLIVQGETDIQVTPENARQLAKEVPEARLKMIPEMNHVLKNCKSTLPLAQQATYVNPDLPINQVLAEEITGFIRKLP